MTLEEIKAKVDRAGDCLDAAHVEVAARLKALHTAEEEASRWHTIYRLAVEERDRAIRAEAAEKLGGL